MKKYLNLLILCISFLWIACEPEPGPQPMSSNQTTNPNTSIASMSDTVSLLTGTWRWDSVVQYSAGVRTFISASPSAGGWGGSAEQSINFTMTKYNGLGNGSAIGTNYCEAIYNVTTLTPWSVERQYPLNKLNAINYTSGNIYSLSSNRLVITDWSGAGTKNGMFYYHHK